eukprot:TRINITY_DN30291_c0_g1_i2.p1 TRINITY_DN30291_c0_g1~~TRINITY_DN30291_c0_g1_i2.p1  ORF type:complete len:783 (+),score=177.97 TRINITY_DN30291_c0_g1_i2:108-2351(+)
MADYAGCPARLRRRRCLQQRGRKADERFVTTRQVEVRYAALDRVFGVRPGLQGAPSVLTSAVGSRGQGGGTRLRGVRGMRIGDGDDAATRALLKQDNVQPLIATSPIQQLELERREAISQKGGKWAARGAGSLDSPRSCASARRRPVEVYAERHAATKKKSGEEYRKWARNAQWRVELASHEVNKWRDAVALADPGVDHAADGTAPLAGGGEAAPAAAALKQRFHAAGVLSRRIPKREAERRESAEQPDPDAEEQGALLGIKAPFVSMSEAPDDPLGSPSTSPRTAQRPPAAGTPPPSPGDGAIQRVRSFAKTAAQVRALSRASLRGPKGQQRGAAALLAQRMVGIGADKTAPDPVEHGAAGALGATAVSFGELFAEADHRKRLRLAGLDSGTPELAPLERPAHSPGTKVRARAIRRRSQQAARRRSRQLTDDCDADEATSARRMSADTACSSPHPLQASPAARPRAESRCGSFSTSVALVSPGGRGDEVQLHTRSFRSLRSMSMASMQPDAAGASARRQSVPDGAEQQGGQRAAVFRNPDPRRWRSTQPPPPRVRKRKCRLRAAAAWSRALRSGPARDAAAPPLTPPAPRRRRHGHSAWGGPSEVEGLSPLAEHREERLRQRIARDSFYALQFRVGHAQGGLPPGQRFRVTLADRNAAASKRLRPPRWCSSGGSPPTRRAGCWSSTPPPTGSSAPRCSAAASSRGQRARPSSSGAACGSRSLRSPRPRGPPPPWRGCTSWSSLRQG